MIYGITLILLALLPAQEVASRRDVPGRCDAAFLALFTPKTPASGHYEICIVDASDDASRLAAEPDLHLAEPERLEPLDAFGTAGSYNRSRLSRLYGGLRVTVRRGWRERANQFESITLLSPYPDATLSRLHSGTMVIRWITDRP